MRKDVVCYRYICPLAYRSKCPASLRLTKGPTSVVLEKIHSHDAEVHSKDHAKGLKWQQKESIAQAVSVAPLQSGTQIRRNLHRDSPEKRIEPSYNRCLCRECRIRRLISCLFFRHVQRPVSSFRNRMTAASVGGSLSDAYGSFTRMEQFLDFTTIRCAHKVLLPRGFRRKLWGI